MTQKKQVMTYGPRIKQTHLRKKGDPDEPTAHKEPVIVPKLSEFERDYVDDALQPADATVILPAEAQAQVDREKAELEREENEEQARFEAKYGGKK